MQKSRCAPGRSAHPGRALTPAARVSPEAYAPAASELPSCPSVANDVRRTPCISCSSIAAASAISWLRPPMPLPLTVTVVSPAAMMQAGAGTGLSCSRDSRATAASSRPASRASPVSVGGQDERRKSAGARLRGRRFHGQPAGGDDERRVPPRQGLRRLRPAPCRAVLQQGPHGGGHTRRPGHAREARPAHRRRSMGPAPWDPSPQPRCHRPRRPRSQGSPWSRGRTAPDVRPKCR